MPVLAPAVIAVGAAVGTGATVGGGLAGIGLVAGAIGTTLSVVGKITKSKLLGQIGMGLGIAGAVAGFGGMAASAGLFGETAKGAMAMGATQSSLVAAPGATASAAEPFSATIAAANKAGSLSASSQSLGTVGVQSGAVSNTLPGVGAASAPPPGLVQSPGAWMGGGPPGTIQGTGVSSIASGGQSVPGLAQVSVPGAPPGFGGTTIPSIQPQSLPTPSGAPTPAVTTGPMYEPGGMVGDLVKKINDVQPGGMFDFFKNLDPTTKALLINTAGQGVSGTVGGIFSSIQADRQAELLEQINRENRQYQKWQSEQAPGLIQYQHPQ